MYERVRSVHYWLVDVSHPMRLRAVLLILVGSDLLLVYNEMSLLREGDIPLITAVSAVIAMAYVSLFFLHFFWETNSLLIEARKSNRRAKPFDTLLKRDDTLQRIFTTRGQGPEDRATLAKRQDGNDG